MPAFGQSCRRRRPGHISAGADQMTQLQYRKRIFICDEFIAEERRKYLIVVIYDIIDKRRRAAFAKYLQRFVIRVQKSAFECILPNAKYEKLIRGIPGLIEK